MERRTFIAMASGGLLAAPRAAGAQQAGMVFRIGILANLPPTDSQGARLWGAFTRGLRELGYTEGQNIAIEWRVSEGKYERLPELAAELVRLKVDVIVVTSSTDPVGSGLVPSLARPAGNIPGLSATAGPEIVGKQMELLKAMVPQVSRMAILSNPANPAHAPLLRAAGIVAPSLRVHVQTVEARGPEDFGSAFAAMTRERAGALLIPADGMFLLHLRRIADLAAKNGLPTMGLRSYVNAGGLMSSYGVDQADLFRRAATYVDKILKGAKPADLPVEQPTKFELIINLKTAKALGITIPPSLLGRADEVIQ